MPRVLPSQVVGFISSLPNHLTPTGVSHYANLNQVGTAALSATLELIDQIPNELLVMDAATYLQFVLAKERIRDIVATWRANQTAGHGLHPFHFARDSSPLAQLQFALAKCPDESPSPSTSELKFIADVGLLSNLRIDMGAINRALSNGEWKAVTVLAGSTLEALLLWALEQRPSTDINTAITALKATGDLKSNPKPNLEDWVLHEYTEVAAYLNIVKPGTATETRLAREFRNLIHPGRAKRLAQECDRGTALSSVAALEHVVRDLS